MHIMGFLVRVLFLLIYTHTVKPLNSFTNIYVYIYIYLNLPTMGPTLKGPFREMMGSES